MDMSKKRKLCAILKAISIFFTEDVQDEDTVEDILLEYNFIKRQKKHGSGVHINNYVEDIVPALTDVEFQRHFRMKRNTAEIIIGKLANMKATHVSSTYFEERKAFLAVLWLLSTPECYRSVGERFGLSIKRHPAFIVQAVCGSILFQFRPTLQEQQITSSSLMSSYGYPGVIGAVDGSHIAIKQPIIDKDAYINRKGFASVVLQGTCNHTLSFIDCYCNWPGSVHDARVFRHSSLPEKFQTMPEERHILGDSAYTLQVNLMTPVRDNGHLTHEEKRHNMVHSSARAIIERAFALLKGKFRRLKYLDMDVDNAKKTVITACCLHNAIINIEGYDVVNVEMNDPDVATIDITERRTSNAAKLKRNNIMANL